MMEDEADEVKATLTSTMENIPQNVLLSENNDKSDANDSTPTSSTDAASRYSTTSVNATEDPISSTSSDVSDKRKALSEDTMEIKSENIGVSKSLIGSDSDVDLLDIAHDSSEPINEDVEDIVQDLENLLGESEPTKDYLPIRKKHVMNDAFDSELVTLKNLVDVNEQTDEMTLELIQEEDRCSNSLNVVQIAREGFEGEQLMEKLSPKTTDSEGLQEKIDKLQEQLEEQAEPTILLFDNSENVPNIGVPKDNEKKCELQAPIIPVKEIECEIKHSEEKNVYPTTSLEVEKFDIETKDDDPNQIITTNVIKLQIIEDVPNKNEDNSAETNLNVSDSSKEIGQSSQDPINRPSLESECLIQDIEIVSIGKDQPSAHYLDISEIPSLISEGTADSENFHNPSLDSVHGQSSVASLEMDGGKSELQENLNSEHILPEISCAITEQIVDIDEIVKSAVDNVVEDSTSPNDIVKLAVDDVIDYNSSSHEIVKLAEDDAIESSISSNKIVKSAIDDVIEASTSSLEIVQSAVDDIIESSSSNENINSAVDDVIEGISIEIVKSAVDDVIEGSTSSNEVVNSALDVIEGNNSSDEVVNLAADDAIEDGTSSNDIVNLATDDVIEGSTSSNDIVNSALDDIEGNTSSNEIVKSAVDVIECSTSSSPLRKEEFSDQVISSTEEKMEVIQEALSGKNIVQDHKKTVKPSESKEFIQELTGELVPKILEQNSGSIISASAGEIGDYISSSPEEKIDITKNIESLVSDVGPISSNLPTATDELSVEVSETSTGESIDEKKMHLEDETGLVIKDTTEQDIENKVPPEEINDENESVMVIEHIPEILTDNETDVHVEGEIKVILEDKTENIVATVIDDKVGLHQVQMTKVDETVSALDEVKTLEIENELAAEANTEFNVTDDVLEEEPELHGENENEIVKNITDAAVNIACESVVEDHAEQDLHNLSATSEHPENESELAKDVADIDSAMNIECESIVENQLAQDIQDLSETSVVGVAGCNVEVNETESVENKPEGAIEQTKEDQSSDLVNTIVQDRNELSIKDESELEMEGEVKTAENESEIIKDNVEFEENKTNSTTNNKSELVLADVSMPESEDKSETLEKGTTIQIVEEERCLVSPSNFEPEMYDMVVNKPENSPSGLPQPNITGEKLKIDIKKMEDEIVEAQINEISSASISEAAKSSEINLEANNQEKREESFENLKKVDPTNARTIESDINKGEKSIEQKYLVPVAEEFIVKKTIIYEHDCHHKNAHSYENEELKEESTLPEKKETILSNLHGKCDENDAKMTDNNLVDCSSSSKDIIEPLDTQEHLTEDNHNVQKLDLHEGQESQSVIVDCAANSIITNLIEGISEKKGSEEIDISDSPEVVIKQSEENVQSSKVIEDTDVHYAQPEISNPSQILDSSLYCDTSEKRKDQSGDNLCNTIHDQTTAAVQSILDNMLAEEQNVVLISDKEETPVVHSSYSSYELQKAVQQIQDISKMDVNEDLSSEEVPYVEDVEKPKEPVEIVRMVAESSEANLEEYERSCVQTIEAESTTVSLPEQNKSIGAFEPESSVDDLVENPQPSASDNTSEEESDAINLKNIRIRDSDQDAVKTVSSSQSPGKHVESQSAFPNNKKIEIPLVEPSIDLSEESSNEECSESEHMHDKVSSTCISPEKFEMNIDEKATGIPKIPSPLRAENVVEFGPVKSDIKKSISRETRHSSRISEKSKDKPQNTKENVIEPLTINIDEMEKEKNFSPKVAVKIKDDELTDDREEHKGSLKITITKQSDNTHSILKICSPDTELRHKISDSDETGVVPKLVIKTSESDLHSPKMSTRSSKQTLSSSITQKSGSPRITIKPIPKPESKDPITSPLKITIKPMGKPEEFSKQQQKHSPKVTKSKSEDDHYSTRSKILKLSDNSEVLSHKVIIKPIVKPSEDCEQVSTPKITIKPFDKPESEAKVSPKITIKPLVRPVDLQSEIEEEIKERIVLKINKGTIPSKDIDKANRDSRKREHEDDKSEKLAKIKLKFSKGGDAHIVHEANVERRPLSNKRPHESEGFEKNKRSRCDNFDNNSDDDVKIVEDRQSPIVISEDSRSQDSVIVIEEGNDSPPGIVKTSVVTTPVAPVAHVPKKRGRPRKVPLVVREDFGNLSKEQSQSVPSSTDAIQTPPLTQDTETSGRPKRSCRGQSVRDTLGMKPRKSKAPSKPRGAKRGSGLKTIGLKVKESKSKRYK
ncbi:hypothetical protein WA026_012504 [Henosepilachna vigintioctopunctata]|uniref:PHD finger protein 10 n=1 Tax=Henosepilachna vigintioctopunctata TaxID=420089 RepID=A0AAW1V0X4_9CUCU